MDNTAPHQQQRADAAHSLLTRYQSLPSDFGYMGDRVAAAAAPTNSGGIRSAAQPSLLERIREQQARVRRAFTVLRDESALQIGAVHKDDHYTAHRVPANRNGDEEVTLAARKVAEAIAGCKRVYQGAHNRSSGNRSGAHSPSLLLTRANSALSSMQVSWRIGNDHEPQPPILYSSPPSTATSAPLSSPSHQPLFLHAPTVRTTANNNNNNNKPTHPAALPTAAPQQWGGPLRSSSQLSIAYSSVPQQQRPPSSASAIATSLALRSESIEEPLRRKVSFSTRQKRRAEDEDVILGAVVAVGSPNASDDDDDGRSSTAAGEDAVSQWLRARGLCDVPPPTTTNAEGTPATAAASTTNSAVSTSLQKLYWSMAANEGLRVMLRSRVEEAKEQQRQQSQQEQGPAAVVHAGSTPATVSTLPLSSASPNTLSLTPQPRDVAIRTILKKVLGSAYDVGITATADVARLHARQQEALLGVVTADDELRNGAASVDEDEMFRLLNNNTNNTSGIEGDLMIGSSTVHPMPQGTSRWLPDEVTTAKAASARISLLQRRLRVLDNGSGKNSQHASSQQPTQQDQQDLLLGGSLVFPIVTPMSKARRVKAGGEITTGSADNKPLPKSGVIRSAAAPPPIRYVPTIPILSTGDVAADGKYRELATRLAQCADGRDKRTITAADHPPATPISAASSAPHPLSSVVLTPQDEEELRGIVGDAGLAFLMRGPEALLNVYPHILKGSDGARELFENNNNGSGGDGSSPTPTTTTLAGALVAMSRKDRRRLGFMLRQHIGDFLRWRAAKEEARKKAAADHGASPLGVADTEDAEEKGLAAPLEFILPPPSVGYQDYMMARANTTTAKMGASSNTTSFTDQGTQCHTQSLFDTVLVKQLRARQMLLTNLLASIGGGGVGGGDGAATTTTPPAISKPTLPSTPLELIRRYRPTHEEDLHHTNTVRDATCSAAMELRFSRYHPANNNTNITSNTTPTSTDGQQQEDGIFGTEHTNSLIHNTPIPRLFTNLAPSLNAIVVSKGMPVGTQEARAEKHCLTIAARGATCFVLPFVVYSNPTTAVDEDGGGNKPNKTNGPIGEGGIVDVAGGFDFGLTEVIAEYNASSSQARDALLTTKRVGKGGGRPLNLLTAINLLRGPQRITGRAIGGLGAHVVGSCEAAALDVTTSTASAAGNQKKNNSPISRERKGDNLKKKKRDDEGSLLRRAGKLLGGSGSNSGSDDSDEADGAMPPLPSEDTFEERWWKRYRAFLEEREVDDDDDADRNSDDEDDDEEDYPHPSELITRPPMVMDTRTYQRRGIRGARRILRRHHRRQHYDQQQRKKSSPKTSPQTTAATALAIPASMSVSNFADVGEIGGTSGAIGGINVAGVATGHNRQEKDTLKKRKKKKAQQHATNALEPSMSSAFVERGSIAVTSTHVSVKIAVTTAVNNGDIEDDEDLVAAVCGGGGGTHTTQQHPTHRTINHRIRYEDISEIVLGHSCGFMPTIANAWYAATIAEERLRLVEEGRRGQEGKNNTPGGGDSINPEDERTQQQRSPRGATFLGGNPGSKTKRSASNNKGSRAPSPTVTNKTGGHGGVPTTTPSSLLSEKLYLQASPYGLVAKDVNRRMTQHYQQQIRTGEASTATHTQPPACDPRAMFADGGQHPCDSVLGLNERFYQCLTIVYQPDAAQQRIRLAQLLAKDTLVQQHAVSVASMPAHIQQQLQREVPNFRSWFPPHKVPEDPRALSSAALPTAIDAALLHARDKPGELTTDSMLLKECCVSVIIDSPSEWNAIVTALSNPEVTGRRPIPIRFAGPLPIDDSVRAAASATIRDIADTKRADRQALEGWLSACERRETLLTHLRREAAEGADGSNPTVFLSNSVLVERFPFTAAAAARGVTLANFPPIPTIPPQINLPAAAATTASAGMTASQSAATVLATTTTLSPTIQHAVFTIADALSAAGTLSIEEAQLCRHFHIHPALYQEVKGYVVVASAAEVGGGGALSSTPTMARPLKSLDSLTQHYDVDFYRLRAMVSFFQSKGWVRAHTVYRVKRAN